MAASELLGPLQILGECPPTGWPRDANGDGVVKPLGDSSEIRDTHLFAFWLSRRFEKLATVPNFVVPNVVPSFPIICEVDRSPRTCRALRLQKRRPVRLRVLTIGRVVIRRLRTRPQSDRSAQA